MSRRRPKPQENSVPGEEVMVEIVCTGRRTHSKNRLGLVTVYVSAGEVFRESGPEPFVWAPINEAPGDPGVMPHSTRTYRCQRCGRSVPLRNDTENELVIELAKHGGSPLDISALHVM